MENPAFVPIAQEKSRIRKVEKIKDHLDPVELTDEALLLDEVDQAMEKAGFPLNPSLRKMLQEENEHRFDPVTQRANRRGSGFTQAGRFLADLISHKRDANTDAYQLFDGSVIEWLDRIPRQGPWLGEEERKVIENALNTVKSEGGRLLAQMIHDLLWPVSGKGARVLPAIPEKVPTLVGSCSTAENYFLDFIQHGIKEGTVVVDEKNRPLMYQKHEGEPSAITLEEMVVNGVRIPEGSLLAIHTKPDATGKVHPTFSEPVVSVDQLGGVRFLRLSSLSVSPKERLASFGMLMKFQELNEMPDFENATIEDVKERVQEFVDQQSTKQIRSVA